jgi:hypothetical protein
MPNQHKTKLLGWHPTSAEDSAWVRTEAERRGVDLKVVLDEMLREFRERHAGDGADPAGCYNAK